MSSAAIAPDNCGDGKRQLGLLKDDGTLILVAKNFDPFAGAVNDLKKYCNKRITADGLLITTPHMPIFALQFKREGANGKWSRANAFSRDWSAANGDKKGGNWFRKDATVKKWIDQNGVVGIPGVVPEDE